MCRGAHFSFFSPYLLITFHPLSIFSSPISFLYPLVGVCPVRVRHMMSLKTAPSLSTVIGGPVTHWLVHTQLAHNWHTGKVSGTCSPCHGSLAHQRSPGWPNHLRPSRTQCPCPCLLPLAFALILLIFFFNCYLQISFSLLSHRFPTT